MSSVNLLQVGMNAVQSQRFADAVAAFEQLCYNPSGTAQEQIQAQMWLVRAYYGHGQLEAAVALCEQMTTEAYPADVQQWARQTLPSLSQATPALISAPAHQTQSAPQSSSQPSSQPVSLAEQYGLTQATQSHEDTELSMNTSMQTCMDSSTPTVMETSLHEALPPKSPSPSILTTTGLSTAGPHPKQSPEQDPEEVSEQVSEQVNHNSTNPSSDNASSDLAGLSPEALLSLGNQSLKGRKFAQAVQALEAYCHQTGNNEGQAQMWLVKAYKGNQQISEATALCQQLLDHPREYIKIWAKQYLETLLSPEQIQALLEQTAAEFMGPEAEGTLSGPLSQAGLTERAPSSRSRLNSSRSHPASSPSVAGPDSAQPTFPKAGRTKRPNVKIPMGKIAPSLGLASGVTLSALAGMIFSLCLGLLLIVESDNPTLGLVGAVVGTVVFNTGMFFLSPVIMDLVQRWLYKTRWVSLSDLRQRSPESARVLQEVCSQHKIRQPKIGIIDDDNPTAFTYGSLRDNARLVVSQGLFKYLDDDEIATVYAHELGHIIHWDFAIMTLAQTLLQVLYLIYVYADRLRRSLGNSDTEKNLKSGLQVAVWSAYLFYTLGQYILLYLSRTREYHADHFAAQVTGNPNALSRGLVKIAYGIVEEGKRNPEPSLVVQGTRALGIADAGGAPLTGTAYRVSSSPAQVGRVFLWDMFNPWAWWSELNSTHPLTGKRVRALSTYAEHLGLDVEFDMALVMREGKGLNKRRLYGNFVFDVVLLQAVWIGGIAGLGLGTLLSLATRNWGCSLGGLLLGMGVAMLAQLNVMYPAFGRAPEADILTLMSDPYASPLRGKPVRLIGEVIGRGDAGSRVGSDLQFQDATGMTRLHYQSWLGPLGNFFFGIAKAENYVGTQSTVSGWFRRSTAHWLDLVQLDSSAGVIKSYHRLGTMVTAIALIVLGLLVPPVFSVTLRDSGPSFSRPAAKSRTAPAAKRVQDSDANEADASTEESDFEPGQSAPEVE